MFRFSAAGLLAATVAFIATPAGAQYGGGGSSLADPDGGPLGGTGSNVRQRYDKARKGSSITEFIDRLKEENDPEMRLEAVKSLGESGDEKAIDHLMQAANDKDPRIQAKAVEYLGSIRATSATLFLIQKLFVTGTPAPLRHRILYALGRIGDSKASRPILEFIERDVSPDVRGTGIYAIGEIGDRTIKEDLKRLREVEPDPRLQRLIDEALQKIAFRQPAPDAERRAFNPFPSPLEAALAVEQQQ